MKNTRWFLKNLASDEVSLGDRYTWPKKDATSNKWPALIKLACTYYYTQYSRLTTHEFMVIINIQATGQNPLCIIGCRIAATGQAPVNVQQKRRDAKTPRKLAKNQKRSIYWMRKSLHILSSHFYRLMQFAPSVEQGRSADPYLGNTSYSLIGPDLCGWRLQEAATDSSHIWTPVKLLSVFE